MAIQRFEIDFNSNAIIGSAGYPTWRARWRCRRSRMDIIPLLFPNARVARVMAPTTKLGKTKPYGKIAIIGNEDPQLAPS